MTRKNYSLSWRRLLSEKRPSSPGATQSARSRLENDMRSEFERDYDRVVFSAPFRRLARKTQVHPLATNDHIHNRLTHSMEVACISRSFGQRLAKIAKQKSDFVDEDQPKIVWILQAACLIHDLGNPPFGHAGEEVVRAWCAKHSDEMFERKRFTSDESFEACKSNWLHFEGNAQGFRLASRADNPEAGYLNLTHATLAAAIKYPWISTDERTVREKKHSIYSTEAPLFQAMAEELGLAAEGGHVCRHPLSFLTEAADDICYRILDLEDAVEMGIRDQESVRELFLDISQGLGKPEMELPQLRAYAIYTLIGKFWDVFELDFDAIMNGKRVKDLKSSIDSTTAGQLKQIKASYDQIFGHSKKVAMELGAYHIIGRVLKALVKTVQAINDSATYDEVPFLSKRCAELAWGRDYAERNFDKDHVWWLSRMSDFVSGLTDDYATKLSGDIGGHSFFNR